MSLMDVSRVCRRTLSGTTLALVFSVANLHCGDDDDEHPPGPSVGGGNAPVVPERPIVRPGPDSPPNVGNDAGRTGVGGSGLGGTPGFGAGGTAGDPFPGFGGTGSSVAGRSSLPSGGFGF